MNEVRRDSVLKRMLQPASRLGDKAGAIGAIVSGMGCAACFPALASLGTAIGLSFLQEYEGLFVSRLLPLFAALAFLANALGWFRHRQWLRSLLGMIGPGILFVATFWLLGNWWTARLVYGGMGMMIAVAIWDLFSPSNRRCGTGHCDLPAKSQ